MEAALDGDVAMGQDIATDLQLIEEAEVGGLDIGEDVEVISYSDIAIGKEVAVECQQATEEGIALSKEGSGNRDIAISQEFAVDDGAAGNMDVAGGL